jgi:crotonobetainyl-CoA:carnitine CoA-transferase CaiB-like acyl-CoA transferase
MSMLTYPATWALNSDFDPVRTHHSAHPSLVPFQAFASSDGWLVVACPKEKFWKRLAVAVGRPEWASDRRFDSFTSRRENADTLIGMLDEIFSTRTTTEWLNELRAADVPCGPVNTVRQALDDPHTTERHMIVTTDHPQFGTIRQMASAVRVGDQPTPYRRAPQRNEDAPEILSDLLGYSADRILELTERGAFGRISIDP